MGSNVKELLDNSRFYVLASSVLLSIGVAAWLRLQIPSDQLFYIRAEQVFGFLGVAYLYVALIISPLGHVIGKERLRHMAFARRAIGVSAAYFVGLHGTIALWGQLGGLRQLAYLPPIFQWSLAAGATTAVILLLMAATSFDKVIAFMTFKRWKWLHRLVYIGGILAILHIWTVGTHMSYAGVQIAGFLALALLGGLELFCTTKLFAARFKEFQRTDYFLVVFLSLWTIWIAAILALPALVENYHQRRHEHTAATVRSLHDV